MQCKDSVLIIRSLLKQVLQHLAYSLSYFISGFLPLTNNNLVFMIVASWHVSSYYLFLVRANVCICLTK